ncbi:proton-transporting V-type ATPase complex assembly regulator TMEM9-like isoform X2 [Littorina saxatilis]|uniref:Transmembrane protein 9 n=1 Tax=Littorina saxatilis TaxID=31220 RepID=A0AAN9GGL0_9CAEN
MSAATTFAKSLAALFVVVVVFLPRYSEQASFEDVRCKCVCPRIENGTGPVHIKMVEPNNCKCEYVVPPMISPQHVDICHYCECKYESRNTTTIKVVVIFIICVVTLLFVYMLFLLCLDPLIQRRPAQYSQHTDEEEDMSTHRPSQLDVAGAAASASEAYARQRSLLNRVTDEQKKWKGTVQEQRRNIYDRHTMLN